MKNWFLLLLLVTVMACSKTSATSEKPPELPLDLTSDEYRQMLNQQGQQLGVLSAETSKLRDIVKMGERNLDWVAKINVARSDDQKILLTDPKSRGGIPIEKAKIYSGKIIIADLGKWMVDVPVELLNIWNGKAPSTVNPPIADAQFQIFARKMDNFYQNAARWIMMEPWMGYYTQAKQRDVRGFYFLGKLENRSQKLADYKSQTTEVQKDISAWLVQMCINNENSESTCSTKLNRLNSENKDLNPYYSEYLKEAQANWNDFYELSFKRSDMKFSIQNGIEIFEMPFLDPKNQAVLDFVKINVEDEWKGPQWQFKINMVNSGAQARVQFEKGATPHVSGGNLIVMDENSALDDYGNQWTIRHEYGHVLGFPDCYLEFFDEGIDAMVSYQLDITDIMCSRAGDLRPHHYDRLKAAYGVR